MPSFGPTIIKQDVQSTSTIRQTNGHGLAQMAQRATVPPEGPSNQSRQEEDCNVTQSVADDFAGYPGQAPQEPRNSIIEMTMSMQNLNPFSFK